MIDTDPVAVTLPRSRVAATLDEFARVLKPGGRLHLSVAEGVGQAFERDHYLESGDRWFVNHQEDELVELLASRGLVVETVTHSQSHRRWLTLSAALSR